MYLINKDETEHTGQVEDYFTLISLTQYFSSYCQHLFWFISFFISTHIVVELKCCLILCALHNIN